MLSATLHDMHRLAAPPEIKVRSQGASQTCDYLSVKDRRGLPEATLIYLQTLSG